MVYAAGELKATRKKAWRARSSISPTNSRAGDEIRTLDIQLGKLTLYQLSYARLIHRPRRLLGTRWFKSCPQVIANNTAFPERCPGNLRGQLQHSPDGLSYRS